MHWKVFLSSVVRACGCCLQRTRRRRLSQQTSVGQPAVAGFLGRGLQRGEAKNELQCTRQCSRYSLVGKVSLVVCAVDLCF